MESEEIAEVLREAGSRYVEVRYADSTVEGGIAEWTGPATLSGEGPASALQMDDKRISVYVVESVEAPRWCCFDPDPNAIGMMGPIDCDNCGAEWAGDDYAAFSHERVIYR